VRPNARVSLSAERHDPEVGVLSRIWGAASWPMTSSELSANGGAHDDRLELHGIRST